MSPKLKTKKESATLANSRLKGKKVDLRFRCADNPSGVQSVIGVDGGKLQFKCPRCQESLELSSTKTGLKIISATGKKDSKHTLRQMTERSTTQGPKPRGSGAANVATKATWKAKTTKAKK